MFEHQGNKLKSMVKDGVTSVAKLSKALNVNRSNIYYLYGVARFEPDLIKKLKQIGLDVEAVSKQSVNGDATVVELQKEIIGLYKELATAKEEIAILRQQLITNTKTTVKKTLAHATHPKKN